MPVVVVGRGICDTGNLLIKGKKRKDLGPVTREMKYRDTKTHKIHGGKNDISWKIILYYRRKQSTFERTKFKLKQITIILVWTREDQ